MNVIRLRGEQIRVNGMRQATTLSEIEADGGSCRCRRDALWVRPTRSTTSAKSVDHGFGDREVFGAVQGSDGVGVVLGRGEGNEVDQGVEIGAGPALV